MPLETVFVYGSLKRGFVNHHVMTGTKFLGTGITQPGFAMIDLGRYPGVIQGTAVIAGEVFAVPTPLMGRLDRLEDNGRVYRREVTPSTCRPVRSTPGSISTCWRAGTRSR